MMTFGVFLSYQQIYEEQRGQDMYKNMLEMAVLADRVGFDNIWVPEHHLIHYMPAPNALIIAAQVGQHVKRARIGTAVVVLPYHHPLTIAGDITATDNVLEGRFDLGVARGAYKYEFDRFGQEFGDSRARFDEILDVLEKVWHSEDEGVSHNGKFWQFDSTYVWPRPVQKPHPPIWVGCMRDSTTSHYASRGYNVFHAPFRRPMSHIQRICDAFHEAREALANPRGVQRIGMSRMFYVAEREEDAFRKAKDVVINHRIGTRLHDYSQNSNSRGYVAPDPNDDDPDEKEIFDNLLMGTPDQVLEKVEAFDRAGLDHLSLFSHFGPGHEDYIQSMELFAEKVMKPYRERHSTENQPGLVAAASGVACGGS
ncbi:MAG: LLM class flavin-dependent oxidoreductase [Chloroflexi bacterium]|nr:LLM class flavin-dependent oxidoreductase [Chloroflexota bacterium]